MTINIRVEKQIDTLVCIVEDNGKGMSDYELSKIFEPFYTSDRGTYVGLGLYVVYNEVNHLLGGTIQCESESDKGTKFTLILPRNISENDHVS